jgi:PAS domain S-box-containing protein
LQSIESLPIAENKQLVQNNALRDRVFEDRDHNISLQRDALNVLEDVDETKNEALSLASDLEKFKLAVDGVADLVVITDSEGKIVYTNPISKKMTGFSTEESLGKTPGKLWGGKMDREYYASMWDTINRKKSSFFGVVSNRRKDGSEFIAQLQIAPLMNADRDVQFFVGVQRDITSEPKYEEEFIPLRRISFVHHFLESNGILKCS